MQDIRLIALDLDGTVFDDEKNITPRTLAAMRAALAMGVDVVPATGRTLDGVPEEFIKLPGVHYALTSNGATVIDLQSGKNLVTLPFKLADALCVFDVINRYDSQMAVFIAGRAYTTPESDRLAAQCVPRALLPYLRKSRTIVPDMRAMLAAHPNEIEKFSVMYRDAAVRDEVWQRVCAACEVEAASSIPNNVEFSAKGVTKGRGLMALAGVLGLSPAQVMACGDSGNDLAMIQQAGLGVAMGNADDDIKAAAQYITADNNHDGVAEAIEKFVLKQPHDI